ncbi:Nucleotide-binding universal stress protein, UspA family [Natrinema salifodinae]|uniref:Nucleotide-binding universal stress protein, UspA family n=2 Tax=Natrinema salifodinae TaxID=1202768 RepID=A0A1I0Q3I5_9EURY|nr:Nucleotide-binding universal stress protein, UspA family [Natrinema salifodinae]
MIDMEQHILVPVDSSSSSESAFEYVLEEIPEPTITLLHVLNPLTVFNQVRAEGFDYEKSRQIEQERREVIEQIFDEYRSKGAARDREIKTVIEAGAPDEKILEYTENMGVDHIVMGSRGRSGMEEALLGSVAKAVVKRSSVPVTIVP